jgi:hypothetical protein
MNIVENWKQVWKWISFQCFALIAAGHGTVGIVAFLGIPNEIYAQHGHLISTVTIVLAFLGSFGLLIQQDSLPDWVPWKLKACPTAAPTGAEPTAKSQEVTP